MAPSRSAAARSNPLWLAWLWLLLATIGAHATLPVGSPIMRGNGSAFSAATVDVALAPKRKSDAALEQRQPEASTPRATAPGHDLPFLAAAPAVLAAPWRQPAAAPPRPAPQAEAESLPSRAYRARAPPTA